MGQCNLDLDRSPADIVAHRTQTITFGDWSLARRLQWLQELDILIARSRDRILRVLAAEKGCSEHNVLLSEYAPVRLLIGTYLRDAERILRDEDRSRPWSANFGNKRTIVHKKPLGIVGVISPFNFPFALALKPIISALVAGNAVIFKPSPETPQANALVDHLISDSSSVPRFSMLPAARTFGEALVDCPQVVKIHFTGSVTAGRAIAQANAKVRFIPPTLELGGSNPAIILRDADVKEAARVIAFARFSGLNCNSIKRVFVLDSVYQSFADHLMSIVTALTPDELITKYSEREIGQYNRFLKDLVARGHLSSCELATTGSEVRPIVCLMPRYDRDALVFREETFCPILPVVSVGNEFDAIRYANDSPFGLGASVFTRSAGAFQVIASRLKCGGVYHNDALTEAAQMQMPFGGTKDSGWGYTQGAEGLLDLVQLKTVIEEKNTLVVAIAKKLGLYKPQLYPWTQSKQEWMRKWIDTIIRFS